MKKKLKISNNYLRIFILFKYLITTIIIIIQNDTQLATCLPSSLQTNNNNQFYLTDLNNNDQNNNNENFLSSKSSSSDSKESEKANPNSNNNNGDENNNFLFDEFKKHLSSETSRSLSSDKRLFVVELLKMLHEQYGKKSKEDIKQDRIQLPLIGTASSTVLGTTSTSSQQQTRNSMINQLLNVLNSDGDISRLIDWLQNSFNLESIGELTTQFVVGKLASINCAALLKPDNEETLMPRFLLFNENFLDVPFEMSAPNLKLTTNECLIQGKFDPLRKTVLLLHGYLGGYTIVDGLTNIKNRILDLNKIITERSINERNFFKNNNNTENKEEEFQDIKLRIQKYNVIIVDWFNGANPIVRSRYIRAAVNAQVVGDLIARFIKSLILQCKTESNRIEIIAHSLGCHVAGFTGKKLISMGYKLNKITHLDPIGLCFGRLFSQPQYRLNQNDAFDTQAVHVSLNLFDNPLDGAKANFLINGGRDQAGCGGQSELKNSTTSSVSLLFNDETKFTPCSHMRALALFEDDLSSRENQCQIVAYKCATYDKFLAGKCGKCDEQNNQCKLMSFPPLLLSQTFLQSSTLFNPNYLFKNNAFHSNYNKSLTINSPLINSKNHHYHDTLDSEASISIYKQLAAIENNKYFDLINNQNKSNSNLTLTSFHINPIQIENHNYDDNQLLNNNFKQESQFFISTQAPFQLANVDNNNQAPQLSLNNINNNNNNYNQQTQFENLVNNISDGSIAWVIDDKELNFKIRDTIANLRPELILGQQQQQQQQQQQIAFNSDNNNNDSNLRKSPDSELNLKDLDLSPILNFVNNNNNNNEIKRSDRRLISSEQRDKITQTIDKIKLDAKQALSSSWSAKVVGGNVGIDNHHLKLPISTTFSVSSILNDKTKFLNAEKLTLAIANGYMSMPQHLSKHLTAKLNAALSANQNQNHNDQSTSSIIGDEVTGNDDEDGKGFGEMARDKSKKLSLLFKKKQQLLQPATNNNVNLALTDPVPLGGQAIPEGSVNGPLYFVGTSSMSPFCVNYYQFRILIAESRINKLLKMNALAPNKLAANNYNFGNFASENNLLLKNTNNLQQQQQQQQQQHPSRQAVLNRDMLHLTIKLTDNYGHFFKGFTILEDARYLTKIPLDLNSRKIIGGSENMVELTMLLNTTRLEPVKISETIISYYFHGIVLADSVQINYMSNISPQIRAKYSSNLCPIAINDKHQLVRYVECDKTS